MPDATAIELTDAQVLAICTRLRRYDISLGEMKWALRGAGIYTCDLPDGSIAGQTRAEPDDISIRIRAEWEQAQRRETH